MKWWIPIKIIFPSESIIFQLVIYFQGSKLLHIFWILEGSTNTIESHAGELFLCVSVSDLKSKIPYKRIEPAPITKR